MFHSYQFFQKSPISCNVNRNKRGQPRRTAGVEESVLGMRGRKMQGRKRDFNSLVSFHALRTEILARGALGAGRQFEANFLAWTGPWRVRWDSLGGLMKTGSLQAKRRIPNLPGVFRFLKQPGAFSEQQEFFFFFFFLLKYN